MNNNDIQKDKLLLTLTDEDLLYHPHEMIARLTVLRNAKLNTDVSMTIVVLLKNTQNKLVTHVHPISN